MRVIGGSLRSRRLIGPPEGVRPTSDRVRESIFARLGDVEGARVLDLFAGTGALSIEALSRGAQRAVLVDRSARSLDVVQRNLAAMGLADRARALRGDARRILPRLQADGPFDLVFLDPPYDWEGVEQLLQAVVGRGILAEDAVVVVEGPKRHALAPPRGLVVQGVNDYGETRVTRLKYDAGHPEAEPNEREGREPRA